MDPVIEQAEFERQQDEEFWENKRRDEQQTRRARSQRDPAGTEASSDRPSRDEQPAREQPTPDAVLHYGSTIDGPIKQKKTGKPVLTGAVVLLLLLSAAAIFMLWSSDGLPFAKKKSAAPTVNALGGIGAEVVSAGLPATTPLADPALPAITPVPAAPVPVAPQDPKLQEQLDRLEKRMDQLVAGFKAQGYIKDTAGHDGAELLATDFLPHPSTLPPPAPVAATTKVPALGQGQVPGTGLRHGVPDVRHGRVRPARRSRTGRQPGARAFHSSAPRPLIRSSPAHPSPAQPPPRPKRFLIHGCRQQTRVPFGGSSPRAHAQGIQGTRRCRKRSPPGRQTHFAATGRDR